MIDFKGDLSKKDADVLKWCAENSSNVLEFGCGGSTQIIAAYLKGSLLSVDTEQSWIDKTIQNLDRLGIKTPVSFEKYETFNYKGEYDFIFVDGLWERRLSFANRTWKNLKLNGIMVFHDTRRQKDIDNVSSFLKEHWLEVGTVYINKDNSNITVIQKKEYTPYENWNKTEK